MNVSKIQNHESMWKSNLFYWRIFITATEKKLEHGAKVSSSGEIPSPDLYSIHYKSKMFHKLEIMFNAVLLKVKKNALYDIISMLLKLSN